MHGRRKRRPPAPEEASGERCQPLVSVQAAVDCSVCRGPGDADDWLDGGGVLFQAGFDGPVMPVHPSEPAVHGVLRIRFRGTLPLPRIGGDVAAPTGKSSLDRSARRPWYPAAVVLSPTSMRKGTEKGVALRAKMLAAAEAYTCASSALLASPPWPRGPAERRLGAHGAPSRRHCLRQPVRFADDSDARLGRRGVGLSRLSHRWATWPTSISAISSIILRSTRRLAPSWCASITSLIVVSFFRRRGPRRGQPVIVFDAAATNPSKRRMAQPRCGPAAPKPTTPPSAAPAASRPQPR